MISGASGLIGRALTKSLEQAGHQVYLLVRRTARHEREISWDPQAQSLQSESLEGLDAVVHLAGENIAGGRWTPELQQKIRNSRIFGTRLLAQSLCQLKSPPQVLISASATGYYGNRGTQELDEQSGPGRGFLSEVCQSWETEAKIVENVGIRLVTPRIAMVLSHMGGALPPMLIPFRLGLGGPLGPGTQFISWITLEDLVRALEHCLESELQGPVNCCSPQAVNNQIFTDTLARVLHRPAFLPAPALALKLVLGSEMAQGLLLDSARVLPRQLQNSGFAFVYPRLEEALRACLQKST